MYLSLNLFSGGSSSFPTSSASPSPCPCTGRSGLDPAAGLCQAPCPSCSSTLAGSWCVGRTWCCASATSPSSGTGARTRGRPENPSQSIAAQPPPFLLSSHLSFPFLPLRHYHIRSDLAILSCPPSTPFPSAARC